MDIQINHLDISKVCKENFSVRLFRILGNRKNDCQQNQVHMFETVLLFS